MPLSPLSWFDLGTFQAAVEAAATAAFAISGVLAAARQRMDAVGVVTVSAVAAFGGGTLRDVLLDRRPLFWVEHPAYLWFVLALALAAMLFLRADHFEPTERLVQWPDALGLGLFAASGAQVAQSLGSPAVVVVIMGTVTAVFGGVLRDLFCAQVPTAFTDHRPYAVCAALGASITLVALNAAAPQWVALSLGAAAATSGRLLALRYDWRLMQWQHQARETSSR